MDLRVLRTRRIFADGQHNAFTGMTQAGSQVAITFRTASDHMSMDGAVALLHGTDHTQWTSAQPVSRGGLDLRDPKPVWFQEKLWIYGGARTTGKSLHSWRLPVSTEFALGEPVDLQGLPPGSWLWHVIPCGPRLLGAAYRQQERGFSAALYASDDGLSWEWLSDFPFPGNEVYLDLAADGSLWALMRDDNHGCIPTLLRAEPPYTRFDRITHLPLRLQGPMLKRMPQGCVIVCRQWNRPGMRNVRTELLWLEDGREMERVAVLPSGGDTSYASWLDVGAGRALLSYYSSHEYFMETAHHTSNQRADNDPASPDTLSHGADIFLAEISYD